MTNGQPIQTTAAVAHLRYTARRVAINERCVAKQVEWLAADLIEWQAAQIERMRAALAQARSAIDPIARRGEISAVVITRSREALRMIDEAMGENDDR